MKNRRHFHLLLTALGGLLVLALGLFSAYRVWERAPSVAAAVPSATPQVSQPPASPAVTATPQPTLSPEELGRPFATDRQDGVYSILLAGNDEGNGCTDTIMLGKLDTEAHTMDFVSIPRDTLINTNWEVRKLNSVYWGARNNGGDGISALQEHIRRLTGFQADCWAVLDLEVIEQVIDMLGGVTFDVPVAMNYEDGSQGLSIHLEPGVQTLTGEQAMGVCRYRSGYITGDLGRIETQHAFLAACAEQFITLGDIPNLSKAAKLIAEGVDTNLSSANVAWFLRQALHCQAENIRFYTAPTQDDTIHGYSYAVLELGPWLEMINEHLNPYETPVTAADLDLVYRVGSSYTSTMVLRGSWYYYQTLSPAPLAAEPEPVPEEPTEEPEAPAMPQIITVLPGEEAPPLPVPAPAAEAEPLPDFALPLPPAAVEEEAEATTPSPSRAEIIVVDLSAD